MLSAGPDPTVYTSRLQYTLPYDPTLKEPISAPPYASSEFYPSGDTLRLPYTLTYYPLLEEHIPDPPYASSDFPTGGETPSILSIIPTGITEEEQTSPYNLPTEVPTLVLNSEPNKYFSTSGYH